MNKTKEKVAKWKRRKKRIRKKVFGDAQRPRLTVFRSLRHIYAQIVDDETGCTLASASSLKDITGGEKKAHGNKEAATQIGQVIAKKAIDVGIRQVILDRNGYRYHGRIKAVAEGARSGGLKF